MLNGASVELPVIADVLTHGGDSQTKSIAACMMCTMCTCARNRLPARPVPELQEPHEICLQAHPVRVFPRLVPDTVSIRLGVRSAIW